MSCDFNELIFSMTRLKFLLMKLSKEYEISGYSDLIYLIKIGNTFKIITK